MLNKIKKNMVHDLNSSVEGRFGNVTISETEKHDKIKYLNTVLMGEKTILQIWQTPADEIKGSLVCFSLFYSFFLSLIN